jgi:4-hydroxy-L-threonine phosphate dehydrogenase PdxA
MPNALPRVAIATGDLAGIGPEVALKCALDPAVNAICRPLIVSDPNVLARHAAAIHTATSFEVIEEARDAKWPGTPNAPLNVLNAPMPNAGEFAFGKSGANYGLGALASARRAIHAALANDVEAVIAAPQNETSIHAAGIHFDGYPSFVAKETGTDIHDVFLMLCFGERRIVHTTLHVGVAEAVRLITRERVGRAIRATDTALRRLGIASPKIIVGGLNPHAGEGGLFGREEIEIISPAIEDAKQAGIGVEGPYGADTMFPKKCDAFVVMLHDQGHITAKLLAPNQTAGLAIGTPILFSSVAHGSAYDIAGKGVASHAAMVEAIRRLVGTPAAARAA